MKYLMIVFSTEEESKNLTFTVPYAATTLAEAGGPAIVKALVDAIIANQPFTQAIVACKGASLKDVTMSDITLPTV